MAGQTFSARDLGLTGIGCDACGWTRTVPPAAVQARGFDKALFHHWSENPGHGVTYPSPLDDDVPPLSVAEEAKGEAYRRRLEAGGNAPLNDNPRKAPS